MDEMAKPGQFDKIRMPEGYVAAHPKPTPEELKQYYAKRYYQNASGTYRQNYDDEELEHKRLKASLTVHAIVQARKKHGLSGRRFLDVGFGEGFQLQAAQDAGFDIFGVDFSEHGIDSFHPKLKDNIQVGDAYQILDEMIARGEKFDVCVLQNVLEHVIDPDAMLGNLRQLLGPDSILLIQVPNDYSPLQMKALEKGHLEDEFWFLPPDHLSYFNVENAVHMAEKHGYDVIDLFGDFPIDFFLYHPGSNYIRDKSAGPGAHRARIELDLLLARNGLDSYLDFRRSLTACGVGRNLCMALRMS
jgi:2-polyprenyl-3-methyl-5-hydroxy-6-metoxy-1,4-benzoquinol methylase